MSLQTTVIHPTGSRERTLDEVKAEVLRRAGKFSPFESIRPQDAAAVEHGVHAVLEHGLQPHQVGAGAQVLAQAEDLVVGHVTTRQLQVAAGQVAEHLGV